MKLEPMSGLHLRKKNTPKHTLVEIAEKLGTTAAAISIRMAQAARGGEDVPKPALRAGPNSSRCAVNYYDLPEVCRWYRRLTQQPSTT